MNDDKPRNELQSASLSSVPTKLDLRPGTSLDLSGLGEEERAALVKDFAQGLVDVNKKAHEMKVDSEALKKTLEDLAVTTHAVAQGGNAVTISHTQTTSIGRTEVIMGNTKTAAGGKLSKSQTGEKDFTVYYIFGGIFALVLIVALMN